MEVTSMKKIYITPELEVTIFEINKDILSDNETGEGNVVTVPFSLDSEPEVTSDFNDMPW